MLIYHGTNATIEQLELAAHATKNINGFGFYFTNCAETAKQYGKNVICVETSLNIPFSLIDRRYIDDIGLFSECLANGLEWSTERPIDLFVMAEDVYYV
tara:strand:- start:1580 stop:1876 length:297 start_codon:yes stop_codon:yes gene_type:complete